MNEPSNSAKARLILAVFVTALGVRLGYWSEISAHPTSGVPIPETIVGVPCGDALAWDAAARSLSRGEGLHHYVGGRRPFWPVVLAIVYQWFGARFDVAYAFNAMASAATVGLVFATLWPLLGIEIALAVAAVETISPLGMSLTVSTMSEPFGGFLFACWFALLVDAWRRRCDGLAFAAGLCFALANMTRTVTFFNVPFDCIVLSRRWREDGRPIGRAPGVYLLGLACGLAPFILHTYRSTGIVTVANQANILYCATHPEYGDYDPRCEDDANRLGLMSAKERYDFFLKEGWNNLARDPRLYVRRVIATMGKILSHGAQQQGLALAGLLLVIARLLAHRAQSVRTALAMVGRLILAATLPTLILIAMPAIATPIIVIIASWGGWLIVRRRPRDARSFIVHFFIGAFLSIGLIVNFIDRFLLAFLWSFSALWLFGLSDVCHRIAGISEVEPSIAIRSTRPLLAPRLLGWFSIMLAFTLLGRLALVQWRERAPTARADARVVVAGLDAVREWIPNDYASATSNNLLDPAWRLASQPTELRNGQVVVAVGTFTPYRYVLPKNASASQTNSRLFRTRTYDRTVMLFDGDSLGGIVWMGVPVIVPGDARTLVDEGDYCLVGRLHRVEDDIVDRDTIEGIALFSLKDRTDHGFAWTLFASDPDHQRVLKALSSSSSASRPSAEAPP